MALHHCGKDTGKGARGSSALRAAADCEIHVEGSQERRTATVTKAKDGESDWRLSFRLTSVDIEATDREVSSCILEPLGEWAVETSKAPPKRKLTDRQKLALEALGDLVVDGKPLPAEWEMPTGLVATSSAAWRDELFRRDILDNDGKNPRADFKRVKESLQARHLIGARDELVWKV